MEFFTLSNAATGLGIGLVAWLIYQMRVKKLSFEHLILTNTGASFKILQTVSTGLETVSLALLGISRGQETFTSFSRYIPIGVIEVLLTLLFIMSFESRLKKACEDGVISVPEMLGIILWSSPFFILAFLATNQIHLLYLESINMVELTQDMNALIPFVGSQFETNPDYFSAAMRDETGKVIEAGRFEYGAWLMIYATPILNFIGAVFLVMNALKENTWAWRKTKGKAKEKEEKKDDKKAPPIDLKGLQAYVSLLINAFDIDDKKFLRWLSEKIGMDVMTKAAVKTAITSPEVIAGRTTSAEELEELSTELIGSGVDTGLAYLQTLTDDVAKHVKSCIGYVKSCEDIQAERTNPATLAARKTLLNVDYNAAKSGAKQDALKLQNTLTDRNNVINDIRMVLTSGNFTDFDKKFVDKMTEDAELVLKDVAAIKP